MNLDIPGKGHSGMLENQMPQKPVLVGVCRPAKYISVMNSLSKPESPIFVFLCVLCFQGNLYRFYLTLLHYVSCSGLVNIPVFILVQC